MAIEVGVAELKARLSHYIRLARDGTEVIVKDRDEPVARLGPHRSLRRQRFLPSSPARGRLEEVPERLPPVVKPGEGLKLLEETRGGGGERWLDEWLNRRRQK